MIKMASGKTELELKKGFCIICGNKIDFTDDMPDYCKKYCCGQDCPNAHISPCASEKKYGTFFDVLKKMNKNEKKNIKKEVKI